VNNQRKPLDRDPVRAQLHALAEKTEEELREGFLATKNFESSGSLESHFGISGPELFADFVRNKKKLSTMQGRFELAFKEPYAHLIPVVELGFTSSPDNTSEIDVLKQDYNNFLTWAIENGITDGELSRDDSYRKFEIRAKKELPDYIVMTRSRSLFEGSVRSSDKSNSDIIVTKRMTFSMPTAMYHALTPDDPKISEIATMRRIEQQIDGNHKLIYPIHTAYYLMIKPDLQPVTRES
jgi:hypothetical protein